jgi:hypothetical protein
LRAAIDRLGISGRPVRLFEGPARFPSMNTDHSLLCVSKHYLIRRAPKLVKRWARESQPVLGHIRK